MRSSIFAASVIAAAFSLSACGESPAPPPATPATPAAVAAPPPAPPAPRVEVRDNKIVIHEKVQFEVARAVLKPESFGLLDEVASTIQKNGHIKRVAVEGHASAEGSEAFNAKLSDERAKAVADYLVRKGVPVSMLVAKGYGVSRPLADNGTEEGREKNRRVEFTILEQQVTARKLEIDGAGHEKVVEETTATVSQPTDDTTAAKAKEAAPKR